jgi:hypothetical protein
LLPSIAIISCIEVNQIQWMQEVDKTKSFALPLFFVAYNLDVIVSPFVSVFEFLHEFFLRISIRHILYHDVSSHILAFLDDLKMFFINGNRLTTFRNLRWDSCTSFQVLWCWRWLDIFRITY